MQFPEHEKMAKIQADADVIAGFLEWLEMKGIEMLEGEGRDQVCAFNGIEDALAQYFDIDLEAIRLEKAQMLGVIRAQNDGYDPKHQYQPDEIVPDVKETL